MTAIIVAAADNDVIGANDNLPWHLGCDMARFKALTIGHTVIMGRRTWDSLPQRFRPLPGRDNIVLTRQTDFMAPGAEVGHGLAEVVQRVQSEAFIIGGAEIYAMAIDYADIIHLTRVHTNPTGDKYFPRLSSLRWRLEASDGPHPADASNDFAYTFLTYRRRRAIQP